jgi:asparagine synthase (glutamine-hydrolysing)
MCGILAVLGYADEASHGKNKRARVLELSRRLKHRGPDWSGLRQVGDCYLSHQRLAIIDPASGDQPLYNEDQSVVVAVNGEIYNHRDLRTRLAGAGHSFRTGSDCEVIAHLVCLCCCVCQSVSHHSPAQVLIRFSPDHRELLMNAN